MRPGFAERHGRFHRPAQTSARSTFHDSQDTLFTLAADTGGKALLDNNDLTLGIKAVQTDISSYYFLAITAPIPRRTASTAT